MTAVKKYHHTNSEIKRKFNKKAITITSAKSSKLNNHLSRHHACFRLCFCYSQCKKPTKPYDFYKHVIALI